MTFINRVLLILKNKLDTIEYQSILEEAIPFDNDYPWLRQQFLKINNLGSEYNRKPQYIWGVLNAAAQAKVLGYDSISVFEFGVAKGNGLISLEKISMHIESLIGIRIDVFGFDTGKGMPKPTDYKDCPHIFEEGEYFMDVEGLQKKLAKTQLIIGPIKDTISEVIHSKIKSPIGFISIDVDYYSSTIDCFELLKQPVEKFLPRPVMYFDDIFTRSYSDFNGERLAIDEWNTEHTDRKIGKVYGLQFFVPHLSYRAAWPEAIYLFHLLTHSKYNTRDIGRRF